MHDSIHITRSLRTNDAGRVELYIAAVTVTLSPELQAQIRLHTLGWIATKLRPYVFGGELSRELNPELWATLETIERDGRPDIVADHLVRGAALVFVARGMGRLAGLVEGIRKEIREAREHIEQMGGWRGELVIRL